MAKRDYYEVLGVDRSADADEIKRSYRKLAMKLHPDRNSDDPNAEDKFKELGEAYSVLSDPDKRARYDRFGHDAPGGMGGFGAGGIDPFEIFREFMGGFGGMGDIFGGGFGGGGRRRGSRVIRGRDMQVNLSLTLEEIAEGTTKKIRVSRYNKCDNCDGSGASPGSKPKTCSTCGGAGQVRQVSSSFLGQVVNISDCPNCSGSGEVIDKPCSECSGEGRVRSNSTIEIEVPPGVKDGNYLNKSAQGHSGPKGGPSGDLIVVFVEKRHPIFERSEDDIVYKLNVSIPDAILGADVEVPTLDGKVRLTIPAGVQPGKVLRLRNKGIPHLNLNGRGDMLVKVNVWVPKKLSPEEIKKFEKMRNSENFIPPVPSEQKGFFDKMKEKFFGE